MADQTDVESTLVGLLTGIVYPNGTANAPGQGVNAQIFPGWPTPDTLSALIAEGAGCIWVYARPEIKEATRYPQQWQVQSITPATITATAVGQKVTIGGTNPSPFSPQNVFVFLAGQSFNYSVQPSDTPTTIATALANEIAAVYPATTNSGPVITVSSGPAPTAQIGSVGTTVLEVGRFEQAFQICIAANSPAERAALASAIQPVLMFTPWLYMPDGMAARLVVRAPVDVDTDQKLSIYRRDIRVTVEFATTQVQTTATVEALVTSVTETISNDSTSRSYP